MIPVQVMYEHSTDPEWQMRMDGDAAVFYLPPRTPKQDKTYPREFVEGHVYREQLLAIRTPEDALQFLRKYDDPGLNTRDNLYQREIPFSTIVRFQELLRKAATTPLTEWSRVRFPKDGFGDQGDSSVEQNVGLTVYLEQGALVGRFENDDGSSVCLTDLFFELAAGVEFRLCEREGCSELFRVETQLNRKYCSGECAHISAMRAWRARKKKSLKKKARRAKHQQ